MKIYKEGTSNFFHFDDTDIVLCVPKERVGFVRVADDTKIEVSIDTVGLRGETNVQRTYAYADVKNSAGTAHGATWAAIITSILG
jgi:hypothetical protein